MTLFKNYKSSLRSVLSFFAISASLTFVSCQDEDRGFTTEEIRASVYARNFEKMYGKIAEDQIWDFSKYNLDKLGLTGGLVETRVPNDQSKASAWDGVTTNDNYYRVSQTTINWLNANLTEKVRHDDLVSKSFSLTKVAGNDFYIVPIYQGQSGMIWDLELVDDNGRHLLWSKSENFKYNYDFANRWEEYFYETGKDTYSYNKGLKFKTVFSIAEKENLSWAKMVFVIPPTLNSVTGRFVAKTEKGTYPIYDYWFNSYDGHASTTSATYNNNNGTYTFTRQNNPIFNADGATLYSGGNQIDLTRVLAQYFWYGTDDDHDEVGHHLQNLAFEITSFEKTDNNSDANARFYTWDDDLSRIKVFVKYDGSKTDVTLSNSTSDAYFNGHTISKHDIDTKVLIVHSDKIQGDFHFNLHTTAITSGDTGYAAEGDNHESTNGYMYAITHFDGTVINKTDLRTALNARGADLKDDNYEFMVLGCEDADNEKGGDRDYNDVVFLVVGGPYLPEISDDPIRKRYMIEDLGSTFDFDFNDIVVDVTEEHVRSVADQSKMKIRQKATISHLSGTIPFKVFIGSKTFGDKPMYGHNSNNNENGYTPTNADYSMTLYESQAWESITNLTSYRREKGIWDPDANNIKMYVWPGKTYNEPSAGVFWNDYGGTVSSDGSAMKNDFDSPNHVYNIQEVVFPHKGKFPYIIATDPSVMWMKELVSIPEWWIRTVPQEYKDYNGNGGGNSGSGSSTEGNKNLNNGSVTLPQNGQNYTQGEYTLDQTTANSLVAGDKLVFTATNGNLEVVLGGDWDNHKYTLTSEGNGKYSLTLNDTQINVIKNNRKITLNGGNVTVSACSVEKASGASTGEVTTWNISNGNTNSQCKVIILSTDGNITKFAAGKTLKVYYTGNGWVNVHFGDNYGKLGDFTSSNNVKSIVLSSENVANIKAYGLSVQTGDGATVTKVTVE